MLSNEIFTYELCACVMRQVQQPIKVLGIFCKVIQTFKKSSHMFHMFLLIIFII